MEREHLAAQNIPPQVADELAERLHQLSMPEAERILQRAIALQAQAHEAGPTVIDTDMLARIAAELQVDPAHLKQALAEELLRLDATDPGWVDRLIGPEGVAAQAVVGADPVRVRAAIDNWLGNHEGMRKRSESASETRWERDPGIFSGMRMAMGMGSGAFRGVGGVTTTVRPVSTDHQLVRIEADTGRLRRRGVQLLAAAAAVGGLVAAGGIAADGFGWTDLAAGAAVTAVTGGGVLLGMRMWVNRIRDAVGRAVDAFANPGLVDQTTGLAGLIGRFFGGGGIWIRRG